MTNANYVDQLSESVFTLVKESPTLSDEVNLETDEYFALILNVTNKSYLRNYSQYKNSFNYNTTYETYDFAVYKQLPAGLYYISKSFTTMYNLPTPGRIIIVSVSDTTKCLEL